MDKKNIILNLNNILLSAFSEKEYSDLREQIIAENSKLLYNEDNLNKNISYTLEEEREPALIDAIMYLKQQNYACAFYEFLRLLKENPNNIELKKSICICLINLKAYDFVVKYFVSDLKRYIDTDDEVIKIIAGAYYGIPKYYKDAIPLYEKIIKHQKEEHSFYYRLAYLYERVYQDKHIDIQIKYALKAREYADNKNQMNTMLGKLYYRAGQKDKAIKCFEEVMNNNPIPEEIVSYSRLFMKEGEISKAYDLYRCRFETGNVTYPKLLLPEKRWDGKQDLSNATVIVHYEQGFGDSVMFSRYIPEIAKRAKKVVFVVQKNLIPIFKSSGFDRYCEILSHEADVNTNITLKDTNRSIMYSNGKGMGKIPHDYHIPLMDTPFLFDESPEKMKEANGYLMADSDKIEEFRKKYIKPSGNLKIGLAYHGTKQSILTYRDISIKKFMPILKMKGIDFYSFQSDEYAKELSDLSNDINIYDLGKEFKNFEDTACAMNCMDLIITTDNVVMNLAGALGLKTFCLFNVYSESRWYRTKGADIGWYKSVKPFQAKTFNDWDNLMLEVKSQIEKDFHL